MRDLCQARLSLIPEGEDWPSVEGECEKRAGHQDFHGTLGGISWFASGDARPQLDAIRRELDEWAAIAETSRTDWAAGVRDVVRSLQPILDSTTDQGEAT